MLCTHVFTPPPPCTGAAAPSPLAAAVSEIGESAAVAAAVGVQIFEARCAANELLERLQ